MSVLNNKVQLYYEPRYIFINISEPNVPNWNMPMNEIRFKLFKSTDNLVQFIIRNNDRKPIDLTNRELWITINDEEQSRTLLRKKLINIDNLQGIAHLKLEAWETLNFPLGYLEFNINIIDSFGSRLISFDESQNCRGFIEIDQGIYPGPRPSLESCKINTVRINDRPEIYGFYSDIFPGTLNTNSYSGVNTASIKLSNFSGSISVYASLEKDIPKNSDFGWFKIDLDTNDIGYENYSGFINLNFICRSYWIMFKFNPVFDIFDTNNPVNNLKFLDKISFRN